jgi:hypothetical protein
MNVVVRQVVAERPHPVAVVRHLEVAGHLGHLAEDRTARVEHQVAVRKDPADSVGICTVQAAVGHFVHQAEDRKAQTEAEDPACLAGL